MGRTAIVIGATGLIGNELLLRLLDDPEFDCIKVFVRRPLSMSHQKLVEYVIDFKRIGDHENEIKGDLLFCCIGTTIKVAGSKEAFYEVDAAYPIAFAKAAKYNGLQKFLLVSSLGATKGSSNFYLKVKGEVESELELMNFELLLIFRPSMLLGDRKEFRVGESVGKILMKALSFIFVGKLKRYRAIHASTVAQAMINASKTSQTGVLVFESDQIEMAGK